jgi:hypothetical protein
MYTKNGNEGGQFEQVKKKDVGQDLRPLQNSCGVVIIDKITRISRE